MCDNSKKELTTLKLEIDTSALSAILKETQEKIAEQEFWARRDMDIIRAQIDGIIGENREAVGWADIVVCSASVSLLVYGVLTMISSAFS